MDENTRVVHIAGHEEPGNQQHCTRCGIAFKAGNVGADGWAVGDHVLFIGIPGVHEEVSLGPSVTAESASAVDCVAKEAA